MRTLTVGVDDSPESLAAADWAADEALRWEGRLLLVHGWALDSPLEPVLAASHAEQDEARRMLEVLRGRLLERHPSLDVRVDVVADGPVGALLEASERADLLVLGSRGLGAVAGFLLGSVSLQVVAHAGCPVVLVRGAERLGEGRQRVLLGLKQPDEPDREVLEFAFGAAAARGLPLHVVHAWQPPVPPSAYQPVPPVETEVEAAVAGSLAEAVRPWRASHPDVTVTEASAAGSASEVLIEQAADASLVVVGRGGRRAGLGARVGPVVHGLLHHAGCPVAVVPHP